MNTKTLKFVTIILVLILMIPYISVNAQEDQYAWVLINTVNYDNEEKWTVANEHESYHNEYSCTTGQYSVKTTYTGRTEDWRNPPIIYGEAIRLSADFTGVPEKIIPGEEVTITINMTASENSLSYFGFSATATVDFDRYDLGPGSRTQGATLFKDKDGQYHFEISLQKGYEDVTATVSAKLGTGREEGELIALRHHFYQGVSMGTNYVYQWQKVSTQTQPTQPSVNRDGMFNQNPKNGVLPVNPEPAGTAFGAKITDISGNVTVWIWVERGNPYYWQENDEEYILSGKDGYWYSWKADLEQLPLNAIIETDSNSEAVVLMDEMNTLILSSNSMITLSGQSDSVNLLTFIKGNAWFNISKIASNSHINIRMSQAAVTIRGTTFVLEEDMQTSTVKVFEGEVEMVQYGDNLSSLVSAGSLLSAVEGKFGNTQVFDINVELDKWNRNVNDITVSAMKGSERTDMNITSILIIAGAVVVIGAVVAVLVINKKNSNIHTNRPY